MSLYLIELNEINFDLVQNYIGAGFALPNLTRLSQQDILTSTSEEIYEHLEPWIQWPSVHTGKTYDEHQVFRLGDAVSYQGIQLFEEIENRGYSVGNLSAMNAANRMEKPAFFIPDPWTDTPADSSFVSRALAQAVSQTVNDNTGGKIRAQSALNLGLASIALISPRRYFWFVKKLIWALSKPWLKGQPFLLYAGTFGKVNGVGYFVDLAAALDKLEANISILLIGEGAEFELVKSRAMEADVLNKNLFIEKSLPKKEIIAAFNAATICSSVVIDRPEITACSANKFFDALAAGKPIFINHGGHLRDLLSRRNFGFSAWQTSIDEAAIILNQKMNDRDWLMQAGKKAKKLAIEYFDRDILAEQLMEVLEIAVNETVVDVEIVAPGEYGE